jgi:two-component system NarL family sensor kinase
LVYHASIPLYAHDKGEKLGILNVVSADWKEISPNDLHLLYLVGELVSMAIQRAKLFAQSTELGALGERYRLARELHDTLAQGLTAVALQLETADVLLESGTTPQAQQFIRQALDLTRTNLEEVRRTVLDLRAAPLEGRTLAEALLILVETIENREGIVIQFDAEGANRTLPSRISSALYRIAQEAINNILQHADAEQAIVQLEIMPDHIHLTVEDDGCGFEVEALPEKRYGLIGFQERTKMLGGTFKLHTAPGEGTRLDVRVPLK